MHCCTKHILHFSFCPSRSFQCAKMLCEMPKTRSQTDVISFKLFDWDFGAFQSIDTPTNRIVGCVTYFCIRSPVRHRHQIGAKLSHDQLLAKESRMKNLPQENTTLIEPEPDPLRCEQCAQQGIQVYVLIITMCGGHIRKTLHTLNCHLCGVWPIPAEPHNSDVNSRNDIENMEHTDKHTHATSARSRSFCWTIHMYNWLWEMHIELDAFDEQNRSRTQRRCRSYSSTGFETHEGHRSERIDNAQWCVYVCLCVSIHTVDSTINTAAHN